MKKAIKKTAMTPISTHSHHRRRKVLLAGFRDVLVGPCPVGGGVASVPGTFDAVCPSILILLDSQRSTIGP